MSVLNKNNYGYLSPSDFNLFAKQAQLDIFEDYFYEYNYQINKENARTSGTGYADIRNGGVQYVKVISVDSTTQLTVTGTSFNASGLKYSIYKKLSKLEEAEKVTHSKITMLSNSILTAPTLTFPSYTQEANELTAYPIIIDGIGQVKAQYIRYPAEPKWTYVSLLNGEPVFNSTAADYQDFEIPLDDEVGLILKILQYAGISIREGEVYQFAQGEEQQSNQEEK